MSVLHLCTACSACEWGDDCEYYCSQACGCPDYVEDVEARARAAGEGKP